MHICARHYDLSVVALSLVIEKEDKEKEPVTPHTVSDFKWCDLWMKKRTHAVYFCSLTDISITSFKNYLALFAIGLLKKSNCD